MKALYSQLIQSSLCTLLLVATGCHNKNDIPPNTLYGSTLGYCEWVSTTTSRGTITPKTVGYSQQMKQWVDHNPQGDHSINYIAFYRNDTLQHRYNETDDLNIADDVRNTIIMRYDTLGNVKWYITSNSTMIQISTLRNPYSLAWDTARSIYQYNPDLKLTLYPY